MSGNQHVDFDTEFPLDSLQRQAVQDPEGMSFVYGSAGTGKTQAIVGRVAHLMEAKHPPAQITCLTPVMGAASELTSRLEQHPVVNRVMGDLFVGDIYQFANQLLRTGGAGALDIPATYTIWDQGRALEETITFWKESGGQDLKKKTFRSALRWHWRNRTLLRDNIPVPPMESVWYEIRACYEKAKAVQSGADLMDLIDLALLALERVPKLRDLCSSSRTRHLLIDQGEDLTMRQLELVSLLLGSTRSLMIAFDYNQRTTVGYTPNHIAFMALRFGRPRTHILTLNQQARKNITEILVTLQAADRMKGPQSFHQWSERESKYKPQLFQVPGQRRDMDLLCLSHIQLLSSRGVPWSDMAILYRQARTINRLRTILLHRDVPYQILMDRSDSKEPCDSHCVMELLTLLLNPLDDRAFRLAAAPGYPNKERALREPASRQVRRISREQELDLVEAGSSYLAQLQEGHPDHASLSYLVHCMRILSESVRAPECTAEQLFQIAKDLVLEFQPPNKAGSEDAGLTALQNAWRETPQPAGKTIVRQLTDLMDSTYSAIRTPPSLSQNSLSVGTLQAAKGRQWPYVFVLDVSADTIPGRPGSGLETKEREQRLFYLAMSRATDCLVFYSPFADSKSEKRRLSSFFDPISHLLDIPAS